MTTAKQRAANRRNSTKSTGPKTAKGRVAVKRNALRHGLTAEEVVIPGEDPKVFKAMAARLHESLEPEGALEEQLVDQMALAMWRWHRLHRVEAQLLVELAKEEWRREQGDRSDDRRAPLPQVPTDQLPTIVPRKLGAGFKADARVFETFPKLQRYEAAIERSYYLALHELQRLQHDRRGGPHSLPAAIDVTVETTDAER